MQKPDIPASFILHGLNMPVQIATLCMRSDISTEATS